MAGKVRLARKERGYGNVVVVRHYNGLETLYAHLNKICVSVNDELNGGDLIGLGGRTGHATGDHLHFETRFLEQPINPLAFIDFEHLKLKSDTLILTANTFTALTTPPNKPTGKTKSKGHKSTTHKAGELKLFLQILQVTIQIQPLTKLIPNLHHHLKEENIISSNPVTSFPVLLKKIILPLQNSVNSTESVKRNYFISGRN